MQHIARQAETLCTTTSNALKSMRLKTIKMREKKYNQAPMQTVFVIFRICHESTIYTRRPIYRLHSTRVNKLKTYK